MSGSSSNADRGSTTEYGFIYGYVCVIERYPGIIVTLILLATLGCGAIVFLVYGIPPLDDPRLGFETRGTELSARDLSFLKFRNADPDVLSTIPRGHIVARRDEISGDPEHILRVRRQESSPCLSPSADQLKIVFESSKTNTNLFEAEHLKSICLQEERLIRTHLDFIGNCATTTEEGNGTRTCCPSWSLGYAVALLNNKSSCSEITQADVQTTLGILRVCSQYYTPDGLTSPRGDLGHCQRGDVVFNIFHYLTLNTFPEDIWNGRDGLTSAQSFSPINCFEVSCEAIYDDNLQNIRSLDDGTTDVVALNIGPLKLLLFEEFLKSDFIYILLGLVLAAIIIWIYTGSFLIMIGSLLNMIFSAVLALFFYRVVFQVPVFLFPNLSALILLIGIGADDTFVYVDLWKAAEVKFNGKNRRKLALREATHHAILTLFVTTLTTTAALYTNMVSNIIASKCFAVFAGTALACNFIYTMTWLPAIIILHDKYLKLDSSGTNKHSFHPKSCLRFLGRMVNKVRHASVLRGIFQRVLPKVVYHLRYVWLLTFFLIGIAGIVFTFVYPRLEITEKAVIQVFKETQPFERYDQVYRNNFDFTRSSSDTFPIYIIWGILPTYNPNRWNPSDVGLLEFDTEFHLGDADTQEWLAHFCEDIKQQWFYGNRTDSCFIDSFRVWIGRPCSTVAEAPCCDQRVFPFSEEIFDQCSKRYSSILCYGNPCSSSTPGLRFDTNGSINAIFLYFDSSVTFTTQFSPIDEYWQALSSWTDEQMAGAPHGLARGWSFSALAVQLGLYDIQAGLQTTTILTIGLALVPAAGVLIITTGNILITSFAVVTISFTVVSTIGTLVLLGWELNISDSLSFTLAVGLSVDFSIHFGVAYGLAPYADRKRRGIFVITTLGSAITAAAISTLAAGAAMVFAVVFNYFQIGTFLIVVMATSWLFSIFFFLPLCMTFGPNGDTGNILNLCRRSCKSTPRQQSRSLTGVRNPAFNT